MCRGVVEELNIYDFLPVIGFQEEWEWEEDDNKFPVEVGDGIFIRMDIDEYHDYLYNKEAEAFVRFRKLGYLYDIDLFQQLYAEEKLERNEDEEEDFSDDEEDFSDEEED